MSNMSCKVSIIVPIYKVEKYLDKCIQSIINQTLEDFEVILVDDGSPDNCGKIADKYAKKHNNISVIHKKNGGLSSARNAGLKKAEGEYIAFIDSDDYIEKDMMEYLYKNAKKCNSDIAACGYSVIWPNGEIEKITKDVGDVVYTKAEALDIHLFSGYIDDVSWNKLYKRELFESIRFAEGKLYEDMIIMPLLLSQCEKVSLHSDSKYYYCKRNDSIGGAAFNEKTLSLSTAADDNYNYCKRECPSIKNIIVAKIQWHIVVLNKMILAKQVDHKYVKQIKREIRKNIFYILGCRYINYIRKIQLLMVLFSFWLYRIMYPKVIAKKYRSGDKNETQN